MRVELEDFGLTSEGANCLAVKSIGLTKTRAGEA